MAYTISYMPTNTAATPARRFFVADTYAELSVVAPAVDGDQAYAMDLDSFLAFDGSYWDLPGMLRASNATYCGSATGTAGAVNTAQTILTRTLPANSMRRVGDRLRVRSWYQANGAAPMVGSTSLGPAGSEILIGDKTAAATDFELTQTYLHYVDNTHANILEEHGGEPATLSAVNVAGFDWDSDQNIIFAQDAVALQFLTIYGLFVDVFPKGVR